MNENEVDITERRKAEQALRQSEERFRLAAKAGRMFAYSWDAATDVIERSGESAKILGIDEAALLTGHQAIARVHPDDREGLLAAMVGLSPEKPFLQVTYRIVRPDESVIWVERHSQAYFDEHGKIKRIVGMIVDITERKRAELVLLRHAAIVESSDDGIVGTDVSGTVTDWNKGAERLFGYLASEAIGKNISFLRVPDRAAEGQANLKRIMDGDVVKPYETICQRKDGTRVEISLTVSPIVDAEGQIVGASGIARDITERKRAQEAISRHSAIVASSEDAIISKNLEGIILGWNAGAENIFGYTEAEAVGQPITILIPPELLDQENKILEGLGAGERIKHYETIRITKAGKRIDVSLSISPIKDSTGRVVGASKIARDITDRKIAEALLRDAQDRLRTSEERLRMGQWAAHIGTFDLNLRTGVNIWTRETEALYGLPPGGFGGTLTAFENLIHPDDRKRIIELTREMLMRTRQPQPAEGEWRVVWPDGSVHWIAGRGQVVMDESGEPSRMLGVNMDITERKLAEQELAIASERLHLAINSGSLGGWDYNLKTGKKVWFGKTQAQLGMAPDEPPGSFEESWDRIHKDDREHLQHALRVARDKHEQFTEEFRVVWRDGTTRWVQSQGRYFYAANGEPERLLGLSVDITQSKKAEQALRESEQRLRLATQAGRMYAYDWDVSKNVVVRTSEHVKILGLVEPMHFPQQQFVDKIHPDDRPKFLAAIAELTPKNPTAEVTYRALAPDGALIWLKSNGCGFFDPEDRLMRVIGMVADVTDQKRAEEALSAMTRKLVEAQEQERARIARELHDDINQRIALLAIELDQLREKHRDLPSEVQGHVQELQQMTSDISSSVYALSHELYSSIPDSLGLAKGMRSWCREFGKQQKMEIDFKSHDLPRLLQEISLCLFRVLQEALHNAAKHSGVKRVEVQLVENSGEIHLIVSDSGGGFDIEAARQNRGLGLISMQERVRLVGGTIEIDSKPLAGTTVHVRVPLRKECNSHKAHA